MQRYQKKPKKLRLGTIMPLFLVLAVCVAGSYYAYTLVSNHHHQSILKAQHAAAELQLKKQQAAAAALAKTKIYAGVAVTSNTPPLSGIYAGWQRYSNLGYNVSFNYPKNWNVNATVSTGNLVISVSQISTGELIANQSSPTLYDNYLEDLFVVLKSYVSVAPIAEERPLTNLTFNDTTYPLTETYTQGSLVQINLMQCTSFSSCTDSITTRSGGSVQAGIISVADQQTPTIPIHTSSSQYNLSLLVLKSLSF